MTIRDIWKVKFSNFWEYFKNKVCLAATRKTEYETESQDWGLCLMHSILN